MRLAKFSMVPLSVSPFLTSTELRLMRGARAWLPLIWLRNLIAGHWACVTSRTPIEASKPRSRLNALSRASNGAVDAPKPSMTAAFALVATGRTKKQSPPLYCSTYRRTRSVRAGASPAAGAEAVGGCVGKGAGAFGAGDGVGDFWPNSGSGGGLTTVGTDQTKV